MVAIRVSNASIGIEYTADPSYLRVSNAAIDVEYKNTQRLRVNNAAIMVEYLDVIVPEESTYHLHVCTDEVTLVEMSGPAIGVSGLVVYADFDASGLTYFSRPDEPGLDILNALTLGCWVWFYADSTDAETGLMSKWDTNDEQSYVLYKNASNELVFAVTTDGTTDVSVDDSAANYADGEWFFVAGRFTPGLELALFVNGTWYLNTTGIPASIYDSSTAFELGRYGGGNYLDGRESHPFLCAYAVSNTMIEAKYAHERAMYMSR